MKIDTLILSHFLIDIDECELDLDDCDNLTVANCINTPGNFSCMCKTGYTGSGRNGTCIGEFSTSNN